MLDYFRNKRIERERKIFNQIGDIQSTLTGLMGLKNISSIPSEYLDIYAGFITNHQGVHCTGTLKNYRDKIYGKLELDLRITVGDLVWSFTRVGSALRVYHDLMNFYKITIFKLSLSYEEDPEVFFSKPVKKEYVQSNHIIGNIGKGEL